MVDNDAEYIEPPRVWLCGASDLGKWLGLICSMTWRALYPTEDLKVRFCDKCRRNVHLCESPEQFVELSRRDECVALLPQIFTEAERNYVMTPEVMDEAVSISFLGMPKQITRAEIDQIRHLGALSAFGVSVPDLPVLDETRRGEKNGDA